MDPERGTDQDRLLKIIARLVTELHPQGVEYREITLDSGLDRDLGLDSLARMELLTRLEKSYGVRLPDQVLLTAETPRDLLRHLAGGVSEDDAALPEQDTPAESGGQTQGRQAGLDGARTLIDVLVRHVRQQPQAEHIVLLNQQGELRITYAELHQGALRVAASLQAAQLVAGETVAIMLPTGRDYFFTFFGVLYAGGIPVPLYPPARPTQIEEHLRRHRKILDNARAALLVTIHEVKPVARLLQSLVPAIRRIITTEELAANEPLVAPVPVQPEDIGFIQYTSGSTGDPKGVVLTHGNLLANIRAMGQVCRVTSEDVFVSWLPLYHDMGLIGAWFGSLAFGCRLVVMSPLSFIARPIRWLQTISRFGGTLSASPNFGYQLCLTRIDDAELAGLDLSSWRMAFNGAEPVIPETMEQFARRFAGCGLAATTLSPVYGLAESSVGLAFPEPGRGVLIDTVDREVFMASGRAEPMAGDGKAPLRFVACGRPLPGHQIRVVDSEGRELPERLEGRLEFKGPSATSGYFRRRDVTARLFHGQWLDSGDLAYIAAGDVYLTGRVKDIIIRGGRNIYPHELEEAIGQVRGVRKGCTAVFGARRDGGEERLVVLTESRQKKDEVIADIRLRINGVTTALLGVAPDEVIIAPPGTVLKTSSGKIRRSACRAIYESGHLGKARAAVWLQLARMGLQSIRPLVTRLGSRFGSVAYAGYCWLLLALGGAVAWGGVQVLPGGSRCFYFAGSIARRLCRLAGIAVNVEGLAHLAKEKKQVLVANHMSYLDAIVLTAVLPHWVNFVAKKELADNIFLNRPLHKLGVYLVDRFDAVRGVADAEEIGAGLNRGECPFFFAEGTLQRMPGLLPFQMGAFVLAAEHQAEVVPVVIQGTRNILRGGSWYPRRGVVRISVLAPVQPATGDWSSVLALRNGVRTAMLEKLGEPDLAGDYTSLAQMEITRPDIGNDKE